MRMDNEVEYLNIIIASNNRLLVDTLHARMENDLYSSASSDDEDNESVMTADDKIEGSVFSWRSGTKRTNITVGDLADKIKEGDVSMVICCAHKTRLTYLNDLMRNLEKSKHFQKSINIWIDEADASIKLWSPFNFHTYEKVNKMWLVSATFFSVVDYFEKIRVVPSSVSHPEVYLQLKDCEIEVNDTPVSNAVEYLKAVYRSRREELCRPGMRLFAPGDIEMASHLAIADELLNDGWAVAILNGKTKCIRVREDGVDKDFPISKYTNDEGPEEVGKVIARMYNTLGFGVYPFAITGQLCLGRGLTFACEEKKVISFENDGVWETEWIADNEFLFDEGIVPEISDLATQYQCAARMVGNIRGFQKFRTPRITTTTKMKDAILHSETIAVNLAPHVLKYNLREVGHCEMEWCTHDDEFKYADDLTDFDEKKKGEEEKQKKRDINRILNAPENFKAEWEKFDSLEAAKESIGSIVGQNMKKDKNGFYTRKFGNEVRPFKLEEIEKMKNGSPTANSNLALEDMKVGDVHTRTFVTYRDINDPNTAVFHVRKLKRTYMPEM